MQDQFRVTLIGLKNKNKKRKLPGVHLHVMRIEEECQNTWHNLSLLLINIHHGYIPKLRDVSPRLADL